jgi:predicted transcriptional regulator
MLTQELIVEIPVLHRQGMSIREISRTLKISRNTVRSYLREISKTGTYGPRSARPSKLDPFRPYLHQWIEAAKPHWIPAMVLFREIQAQGYQGHEGIMMCQHISGHMVKQLFAAIHSLQATNSHWRNEVARGCKTLRYIRTLPV